MNVFSHIPFISKPVVKLKPIPNVDEKIVEIIETLNRPEGVTITTLTTQYVTQYKVPLKVILANYGDSANGNVRRYLVSNPRFECVGEGNNTLVRIAKVFVKPSTSLLGGTKGVEPQFFVGYLKVAQVPSATGNGESREEILVEGVDSHGRVTTHPIAKPVTDNQFLQDEFVYARIGNNSFVFDKYPNRSPIQVFYWRNFEQSSQGMSACEYLNRNPSGALSYKMKSVFGNSTWPGDIIIVDEENNKYLKGFKAYNSNDIRYSGVSEFIGDFKELATSNQERKYELNDGNSFSVLVSWSNPADRMRHAVLDDSRWKALGSVGDPFETGLSKIIGASQTEKAIETAPRSDGEQNAQDGVVVDGSSKFDEESYQTVESSPIEDVEPVQGSLLDEAIDESGKRDEDVQPQEDVEQPLETLPHEDPDEECAFLRAFHEGVQKAGFHYNLRDIVRFHTSLKCCPFTLLGGAPGTGKSSLVTLYAKALLGSDYKEGGYLPIDVSSSWTDPEDLFGYWDMNGNYRVAASGLVPFMWGAANEHGEVAEEGGFLSRIVCFEEMNLARVEHYFSNMIQVLSRPVSERVLKGIPSQNKEGETQCQNQAELEVAENLRFVGTCNFDETTQAFSARFYDRCSYLELSSVENKEPFSGVVPSVENYDAADSLTSYLNAYESWHRASGEIDANVRETYKTLQQSFKKMGVYISPRVETQVRLYILNRPNIRDEKNDDKELQMLALDEAIVQMVLPQVCRTNYPYDGNERLKKVMGICEKSNLDLCKQFLQSQLNQFETPERV